MDELKPISEITPFAKLSLTYNEIGKWFLVKDIDGNIHPCLFWRNHKDKSFVSVFSDKQRFPTQVDLFPPKMFIDSVVQFDPKELFDFIGNNSFGDDSDAKMVQNTLQPMEFSASLETGVSNEEELGLSKEEISLEFENIHREVSSPKILWDFRENITAQLDVAVQNYISENKKLNVGDKVKHIATGKIGIIKQLIFSEDGVRYVGDLVRKDGGVSTNLLTTKKGNLFEELELII